MDKVINVNTSDGPVNGTQFTTVLSSNVTAFFGIPYIKSPVGDLRFKDPQPCDPWTEPINGTIEGNVAPSFDLMLQSFVGEESAIHLNVFTKNINPDKLAPVMVYIHGGGFVHGSSSCDLYSPDYLLQKDVVIVTFNYRIGIFGFLSFQDPEIEVPGNAGLKDQRMALKWIKKNIEHFGGDPNNVTLFGESAGSGSVQYHMLSPLSEGLFQRAILMSGVAINNWAVMYKNYNFAMAKALGWDGNGGEKKAFEIINNTPTQELIAIQEILVSEEDKLDLSNAGFGPSVEPYISEQCIIPKYPMELMENSWGDNIPVIIGIVSDEGLLFYRSLSTKGVNLDHNRDGKTNLVPSEFYLDRKEDIYTKFDEELRKLYYNDITIKNGTIDEHVKYVGDRFVTHGVHRMIMQRMKNPQAKPTYFYRFDFDSLTFNHYKNMTCGPHIRGTCHADDISYIFKNKFYYKSGGLTRGTPEYNTVQRMVGMWTSFATNGNPNCDEIKSCEWKPIDTESPPFKCYNISNQLSFIDYPDTDRMLVWDKCYETLDWESLITMWNKSILNN